MNVKQVIILTKSGGHEKLLTSSRSSLINRFVSAAGKPSKPEGPLDVSDIHKDGCTLKWKKPKDDGGEPIECYLVEKYDPDTGIWLPVGKTMGTDMKVDGLTPGHEYKFRVKAINSEGESEPLETYGSIIARDPFSKIYVHYIDST